MGEGRKGRGGGREVRYGNQFLFYINICVCVCVCMCFIYITKSHRIEVGGARDFSKREVNMQFVMVLSVPNGKKKKSSWENFFD